MAQSAAPAMRDLPYDLRVRSRSRPAPIMIARPARRQRSARVAGFRNVPQRPVRTTPPPLELAPMDRNIAAKTAAILGAQPYLRRRKSHPGATGPLEYDLHDPVQGQPKMTHIKTILLALDFSEDSDDALVFTGDLARALGAEIVLLYVDEVAATVPGSSLAEEHRTWAARRLEKARTQLIDKDLPTRALLREGAPVSEILGAADEVAAGLIVLGSHGRSAVSSILLGSVADRVLRRARIPALVVPHAAEAGSARARQRGTSRAALKATPTAGPG